MEQNNQTEQDTPKIITKKSSGVRFVFTNIFGGVGWPEGIICLIGLVLVLLTVALLVKVSLLAMFVVVFTLLWLTIILIVPKRNSSEKVYQGIWKAIKYLFTQKKRNHTDLQNNNLIEDVINNVLYLKDNRVAKVWKIRAKDISLLTQNERNNTIYNLATIFRTLRLDFDIVKIEQSYNFNAQYQNLVHIANNWEFKQETNVSVEEQLFNYGEQLNQIEKDIHWQEAIYYLVVYDTNYESLEQQTKYIINNYNADIQFDLASENEIKNIVCQLSNPYFKGNILPNKIIQKSNYLQIDNGFMAFLSVSEFPLLVNDRWLFNCGNLAQTNMQIKLRDISEQESMKMLDKAIMRAEMQEPHKASQNINYQNYLDNFHTLLELIQNGNERIKMVSVVFTCYGQTKEELNKIVNTCKNQLIKEQMRINSLKYQQLEFYFNFFKDNKKTKHVYQEMATVSIASSYPFVLPTVKDDGGVLLGANEHNSPVIFDVKHRDSLRNSSNVVVFGLTGSGKTMNVKKQLNWLYCNNTKLYIIDPERDYHSLANYYGGEIIPIGKSDKARINPLEVFGDDLLEHILLLEQWFKILYPTLQIGDVAEWQKTLLAVYKAKNITPQTDFTKLTAKDYPILTDLYNYNEKQEKDKEHKSTLNSVLWKLTQGADGYLWNGISTLSLKGDLIVFDTHELTVNKEKQNAQLFLMLAFLDKEVKKNKAKNETLPIAEQQWICIAIDEAHLLINENNTLALNFLFEMTKRIRKYNGILYIITQNIADFMGNANIKTQAQGIINNCLYQFVHHLAPSDLNDYDDLISASGRLNQYQKDIIASAPTGICLFTIGSNQRTIINIKTNPIEIKAIGNNREKGEFRINNESEIRWKQKN